jgi:GT2 family glycosyltransferase
VISICLPTLNALRFLKERMTSIISQTEPDWEMIVCDSYSDDGTWEYLQRFAGDPRIHLHRVPKEGLYAGWNECLRRARGDLIYIATADDTCEPTLLTTLARALEDHPTHKIAACECIEIDSTGHQRKRPIPLYRRILNEFSTSSCFVTSSEFEIAMMALYGGTWGSVTGLLFRRDLFLEAGLYPTQWGISGDFAWCLRAAQVSGVVHVRQPLATWRIHEGQASNQWSIDYCRIYFQIFKSFIYSEEEQLTSQFGWNSSHLSTLLRIARNRYEQDVSGALSDLVRRPTHFFARICKIYRMDPLLFQQRMRAGFRSPDWDVDPKFGLAQSLCAFLRVPWLADTVCPPF